MGFFVFKCFKIVVILFLITNIFITKADNEHIELSLANYNSTDTFPQYFDLPLLSTLNSFIQITITDIPNANFILLQVHSFLKNISLSYNSTLLPHYHINGTNLGLVYKIKNQILKSADFFIFNENIGNTTFLISAQVYQDNYPIPGGCNLEFPIEISPFHILRENKNTIMVEAEPSSIDSLKCNPYIVEHESFQYYLSENDYSIDSYFDVIKKMQKLDTILNEAKKAPFSLLSPPLERIYSNYEKIGRVFVTIAKYSNFTSVYVPISTYSCNINFDTNACENLGEISLVFILLLIILGFLLCYSGHDYFKTAIFLNSWMFGSGFSLILSFLIDPYSEEDNIFYSLMFGGIFSIFWLLLWYTYGIPELQILLAAIISGFLITCMIFYTGIADIQLMQLNIDFWLLFLCLMLSFTVVIISFNNCHIISCSIVGAFLMTTALVLLNPATNLIYVIINPYRRLADPGFAFAIIDPPYQLTDMLFTLIFFALIVTGIIHQNRQHRNRPPYPTPPSRTPVILAERRPLLEEYPEHSILYT